MRLTPIQISLASLSVLFLCHLSLFSCTEKSPEPSLESSAVFTYYFEEQGDGLVNFIADSTQGAPEYRWRFGDDTKSVITTTPSIRYTFPGNGKFKVTLSYTTKSGELSTTKTVHVTNRLARKFEDLPLNQRDTLRILCVLTHDSFSKEFESPYSSPFNSYENQVFINFLDRTIPGHPKELSQFVIQKIFYKLTPEEMERFNRSADPIAFLNDLFTQPDDPLFQKILDRKIVKAASKIAFYLKDPAPGGFSKYGIGGYSVYEGSYFVLLSPGSYVHELAHSFGLAHDTIRGCNYVPIMTGAGTQTKESCNSLWNEFPEFQVAGTVTTLALLRAPNNYDYAVPAKYRAQFPTGTFLRNMEIQHLSTTPYYRSGIDIAATIADALIAQYNIRQKPSIVNRLDTNPEKPASSSAGRLSLVPAQIVHCPVRM